MLCPLSSSKSLLLRAPGFISEKIIDWHQTIMTKLIWKDVEWRTKTANIVPTVFEQKFAFKSFRLHFWEINWLTSNNNNQRLEKMLNEKQKEQILCPLSSNKSSLLRPSGSISEKMVVWYQTIMINLIGKDVEWLTKPANTF